MIFYRGYKSKYGFDSEYSFIWLSDDADYAYEYGDSVKSLEIAISDLHFADLSTLEDTCTILGYDYLDAIYNPSEEFADYLKTCGFNAYSIEPCDYKCCCILDKTLFKTTETMKFRLI